MLRRIQNQPAEMKTVLTALSDALIAGKSEIFTPQIHTEETQMKEIEAHLVKIGVNLCSSVALYHFANAHYYRGTQRYGSLARSPVDLRAPAGAFDFAVGGCPGHRGCDQRRMVSGAERFWRTHPGADRGRIAPSRRRSIDRPSTLNPFRGLVARNVRIFSYQDRTHTIAF